MFWVVSGLGAVVFGLVVVWYMTRREDDDRQIALESGTRNQLLKRDFQFRVKELRRRHAAGLLDDRELEQAELELKQEAAESLIHESAPDRMEAGRDWRVAVGISIVGLALAVGFFVIAGGWQSASELTQLQQRLRTNPEHVLAALEQQAREQNDQESILRWLTATRVNVDVHPMDVRAWLDYARANLIVGRAELAAQALKRAQTLAPEDPDVLIMMAQSLVAGDSEEGRIHAQKLLERVLTNHPENKEALLLAGFNAFEMGDYANAEAYWRRLLRQLPSDSPRYRLLEKSIAMAREKAQQPQQSPTKESSNEAVVVVRLEISPTLKASLRGDETVFVLAQAVNGPPMPLAVKRLQVGQLPVTVRLSDEDAMQAGVAISSFPQIHVLAKISPSGDAMDKSGPQVRSAPLSPRGQEIRLRFQ